MSILINPFRSRVPTLPTNTAPGPFVSPAQPSTNESMDERKQPAKKPPLNENPNQVFGEKTCHEAYKNANPFTAYLNALRCNDVTGEPTVIISQPLSLDTNELVSSVCTFTIYWHHLAYGSRTFCARGFYFKKSKIEEQLRYEAFLDLANPSLVWRQKTIYLKNPSTSDGTENNVSLKFLIVYSAEQPEIQK